MCFNSRSVAPWSSSLLQCFSRVEPFTLLKCCKLQRKRQLQREENKPLIINISGENSVRKCLKDKNILVTHIAYLGTTKIFAEHLYDHICWLLDPRSIIYTQPNLYSEVPQSARWTIDGLHLLHGSLVFNPRKLCHLPNSVVSRISL